VPAPRVLFVGGYPPNLIDGGGIILRGLLATIPPDKLTIACSDFMLKWLSQRPRDPGLLEARYVPVRSWISGGPLRRVALGALNTALIPRLTRTLERAAREADVILAVPWGNSLGSELFVAAFRAHERSGTPLVAFELDEWRASLGPSSGLAAGLLERAYHKRIVGAADAVMVVSDPMAEMFLARFGARSHVFPNAIDVDAASRGRDGERANAGEFRLLFTGSIYHPQAGAIRNVLKAIERRSEPTSLVVYTNQSRRLLSRLGVSSDRLKLEEPVPLEQIPDVLQTGDALLLPFSFAADQRTIVSTSYPTKTADYLASGVPILVHAPEYASVTRTAREGGWAETVSDAEPEQVRAAIDRLATDQAHRRSLARRALRRAHEFHDLAKRRDEFGDLLSSVTSVARG
jgi:glycosyltransferase involved in cell wall biosynthesis